MASVIFRDMKRVSFSCSSSSSAAISNSIIPLRDPKRKKSTTNSNPKSKETQKNVKNPKQSLISPADSSRFLLKSSRLQFEDSTPTFFDLFPEPQLVQRQDSVLIPVASSHSETQQVQKQNSVLVPVASSCTETKLNEEVKTKPVVSRSFSTRRQDQVVELRVSLHCKGCAGKVKKHISKMEGVSSFTIDLESKKVTIKGDVTPLGVLSSVSKVKNAQFWNSSPARASVSF